MNENDRYRGQFYLEDGHYHVRIWKRGGLDFATQTTVWECLVRAWITGEELPAIKALALALRFDLEEGPPMAQVLSGFGTFTRE
jgi:hypothetical protein